MYNHLKEETSPYLLQHAENPVDWYPWCDAAFQRAKEEDKPIFVSIGYSTCHWCHVMAHESFENPELAALLNQHFISIKVDKEERPDIDSIYMKVCQAFTGSGGWPTSIFMTPEQKPFFAGTYFPPRSRGGMIGFYELLLLIHEAWHTDRSTLLRQAEQLISQLKQSNTPQELTRPPLLESAISLYKQHYDSTYGGFGHAPKFPTPHNLLFLLTCYERHGDSVCLNMAEKTLLGFYRGGLFDHIGFGFCRYSTDNRFLVPHFEKMLYDNALLILAYCKAYTCTKKVLYLTIAKQTASYILREMTHPEGGFYSAQDADSEGEEGKYYLFTPEELIALLGEDRGTAFNQHFGITRVGNFEGKSIPNLLDSDLEDTSFLPLLPQIREYRKQRCPLHRDDKILTAWNGLMIAALCHLYRVSGESTYLTAAKQANQFLSHHLMEGDTLFVSFRDGKRGKPGFLDDFASYLFAQLALYGATLEHTYLEQAEHICGTIMAHFLDETHSGFYFYGINNESLILRPKETYDGAIPSGNSLMAWNLVHLYHLTSKEEYARHAERQLEFLAQEAAHYPIGYAMFLLAHLDFRTPPPKITAVLAPQSTKAQLPLRVSPDTALVVLPAPTSEFPLQDGTDTFYVCQHHHCIPPVHDLNDALPNSMSSSRTRPH